MTENNDENVLARAQEIKAERGVTLVEAMFLADQELTPAAPMITDFTVTITVKPRVASWIMREFRATATHSVEDRLGAYLTIVLNRARISAMRVQAEPPEIGKGEAVSMTRDQFQRKAPRE